MRETWNDRALDQLDGRVENNERDIDCIRADMRDAERREARRIREARADARDYTDRKIAERPAPQISPALVITFFATVVVPIAVAFIYAFFRVNGA